MNTPKQTPAGWAGTRALLILAVMLLQSVGARALRAEPAPSGDDGRGVLRYDPISGNLVPIPVEELKTGHVYNHFSKRMNRRVWSYVQDNGRFWYALGEGTTQEAWRLDIRATEAEKRAKLAEIAPDLYKRIQDEGESVVYARLTADNRWVLAEKARFPTIYNVETGYRWERHSGRYIPVSSGAWRYRWAVYRGRYVPADRFVRTAPNAGPIAQPTGKGCDCR